MDISGEMSVTELQFYFTCERKKILIIVMVEIFQIINSTLLSLEVYLL